MVRSIVRACQTDGEILTTSLSQEQTATSDRQMVCRLSNFVDPNFVKPRTSIYEVDEESLVKLSALYIHALVKFESTITEANSEYEPESSSWATMRERKGLRSPAYSLSRADSMLLDSSSYLQLEILQRLFATSVSHIYG